VEIIITVSLKDGLVCTGGQDGHLLFLLQHSPYLHPLRALNELVSVVHLFEITKEWLIVLLGR